jgi:hypothetical protein
MYHRPAPPTHDQPGKYPDMVGPVKAGVLIFSLRAVSAQCPRCVESLCSRHRFFSQGSSLQALPPPTGRWARPRRDVTTVDQSDIRVLGNAGNDPSGASSLYKAGVLATSGWAQGWDEGSPDPYTRRGLARRSLEPDHGMRNFTTRFRPRRHAFNSTSSRAIAHTKPTSSRATAVTARVAGLPRDINLLRR